MDGRAGYHRSPALRRRCFTKLWGISISGGYLFWGCTDFAPRVGRAACRAHRASAAVLQNRTCRRNLPPMPVRAGCLLQAALDAGLRRNKKGTVCGIGEVLHTIFFVKICTFARSTILCLKLYASELSRFITPIYVAYLFLFVNDLHSTFLALTS